MPWITDETLRLACTGQAQAATPGDLPAHWAAAVPRGNRAAYQRLRGFLAARGLSVAQMETWDARVEWNEAIGVNRAHWYATDDMDVRRALNDELAGMMEELAELLLTADGIPIVVASGAISWGSYDTSADTHQMDDVL